ncbi:uncharacterized protein DEA37_0012180 [Paragonimus westermani]|uniref:Uncharacterized protein n=1 Tax=Paragonimus westermani TaxID=34504 RepID=A0A5J4NQQ5_9TREM|nr:uncharacterized protein DEA37_0012180 [Paragonimus westermani]
MIFRRDVKHRIARKLLENVPNNHFLPYPYQLDLLDTSYERNTVICLSNELTRNFIVLNLIREMQYDQRNKHVLYFTHDVHVPEAAQFLARHTGLVVGQFSYQKPYTDWRFLEWEKELLKHPVTVLSPWLLLNIITPASTSDFMGFVHSVRVQSDFVTCSWNVSIRCVPIVFGLNRWCLLRSVVCVILNFCTSYGQYT